MSVFSALYTVVTDAIGRADTLGVAVAKRGINFGRVIAALGFDPVELKSAGTLTATATGSVVLTTLSKIRLINSIYNDTARKAVTFIPEEKFNLIVPSGLTYIEYFYRHGNTIYYNAPLAPNTLAVKYTIYPTELSGDSDACALAEYEPIITSLGIAYAFASLEETESHAIWEKVLTSASAPFVLNAKRLTEYKEALLASGHNV
jgi:hypothetical protein